jgi:hypothetical protein
VSVQAATDRFVAQLLGSMSLEAEGGQMIQADIASITPEDLRAYKLGSILAGGGAAPGNYVRTTPKAWRELAAAFSDASRAADSAAHQPIPVLFGIDAVYGHAKMVGATSFRTTSGSAPPMIRSWWNGSVPPRPRRSPPRALIGPLHQRWPSRATCAGAALTRAMGRHRNSWPSTPPPW